MSGYLIYIIIGAAVGLLLLLLIVGGVVFFVMKKRKGKKAAATEQNASSPMIEESRQASYDLPRAEQENSWAATPEPVPAWNEPPAYVESSANTGDYPAESKPFEASPFAPPPEPPAPFAASESSSPFARSESSQQHTGPMSSPMDTTPPHSSSHATSPNLRMDTAVNMQMEAASAPPPTPPPAPVSAPPTTTSAPPSSPSPIDMPIIGETNETMDLSSYRKIIEEQLKPKSPGAIVFTSGALEGQSFEIPADGFFIGRDSHASQVVIPDPRVSKSHLWLGWKNNKVVVVDQDSRNGTFLNDISNPKVTESEIKDGDTIILGEANVARFEFRAVKS